MIGMMFYLSESLLVVALNCIYINEKKISVLDHVRLVRRKIAQKTCNISRSAIVSCCSSLLANYYVLHDPNKLATISTL